MKIIALQRSAERPSKGIDVSAKNFRLIHISANRPRKDAERLEDVIARLGNVADTVSNVAYDLAGHEKSELVGDLIAVAAHLSFVREKLKGKLELTRLS